jgi:hypothetical protein
MKASLFNMTMTDMILRQQTQESQQHNEKKQKERVTDAELDLEQSAQLSKTQETHKKQRTLMSRRKAASEAFSNKAVRTEKQAETQKTSKMKSDRAKLKELAKTPQTQKTAQKQVMAQKELPKAAQKLVNQFVAKEVLKNLKFGKPELVDREFLPESEELKETQEAKEGANAQDTKPTKKLSKTDQLVQEHLKNLSPEEKKEYVEKLLSGNTKEILDTLVNPKYMIGCNLNKEELDKLKNEIKVKARELRGQTKKALPQAIRYLKEKGLGDKLGSIGQGIQGSASQHDEDQGRTSAIFQALADSLALNGLLTQLGIKSNITLDSLQAATAEEQVEEAKAQAATEIQNINSGIQQGVCETVIKVLTCIIGAILIACQQYAAGIFMILAGSGLLDLLITKIATALNVDPMVIQAICVVVSIVVAIATFNPETMLSSIFKAVSEVAMVAGSVGFITDTLGLIATGQTDASKFPDWVGWASLGINLALSLPEMGMSIYGAVVKGVAKAAAKAAEAATEDAVEAAVSNSASAIEGQAGNGASVAGKEGSVAGGSESVEGASQSNVARANNALENGAGGSAGRMGADGVDRASAAAQGSSTSAADASNSSSATVSAQNMANGAGASSTVTAASNSTSAANAVPQTTLAGMAKASTAARSAAEAVGAVDDDVAAAAAANGSIKPGAESWGANNVEVEIEVEEETDPFMAKLNKLEKSLEEAKTKLAGLKGLQRDAETATEESAAEVQSSLKKAEESVQKYEKEVAEMTRKLKIRDGAVAKISQQIEKAEGVLADKADELAALRADSNATAQDIKEAEEGVNQAQQDLDKLNAQMDFVKSQDMEISEGALKAAEEKLADAVQKAEKWSAKVAEIQKAQKVKEAFKILNSTGEKIAQIIQLAVTGAQAYAEFQLAEIDLELGKNMMLIAEYTGEYELLSNFCEILGFIDESMKSKIDEYNDDQVTEVKMITELIAAERRSMNALLSA